MCNCARVFAMRALDCPQVYTAYIDAHALRAPCGQGVCPSNFLVSGLGGRFAWIDCAGQRAYARLDVLLDGCSPRGQ